MKQYCNVDLFRCFTFMFVILLWEVRFLHYHVLSIKPVYLARNYHYFLLQHQWLPIATERKLQWIFQQEVTATLGMILCGFMIKFWLSLLWMEEQGRCRESGGGVGWGGERCSDLGESGGIWWSLWWFSPLLSHCKTQNCVEVRKPLTGYSSPLPEGESGVILMMF